MCMCHVGGGAATDSPGGGESLWGRFRVRGGVLPPRTVPRTFRGLLLCRAHPCTCLSRCAHCVHRCAGSFVSVLLLHMSPFSNIIHSRSNVLLPISQSRPLQMMAQSLLILLFPTLNTNIMLHAIFVVCIAHGICGAHDLVKALMVFRVRVSSVSPVSCFPKCAALFVCL